MALYSSGRRRTILILLLSSLILITIDMRGNALLDAARSGFDYAFRPFEVAADVVTKPVERAWQGITEVDDLRRENEELRRQVDAQRSDQIANQSALIENAELRALNDLDSLGDYEHKVCSRIGGGEANYLQVIEIDCGTTDGLRDGMPVVSEAGMVGRVTDALLESSKVILITDVSYHVEVKVVSSGEPEVTTASTSPAGFPVDSLPEIAESQAQSTTTAATTTSSPFFVTTTTPPPTTATPTVTSVAAADASTSGDTGGATGGDTDGAGAPIPGTTTTTTLPAPNLDTGVLNGQGERRLPRVTLVADSAQFGLIKPGDQVLTTGGRYSLAPPNIPIGVVANRINSTSSEGQELEIQPSVDLSRIRNVLVILYQPSTELGGN